MIMMFLFYTSTRLIIFLVCVMLQVTTISYVAPCVLRLFQHLKYCETPCYYVSDMIGSLTKSLQRRFQGVFNNTNSDCDFCITDKTAFAEKLYLILPALYPQFGVVWLEVDGPQGESKLKAVKDCLKCKFYFMFIQ